MNFYGIKDAPVESISHESLGLTPYIQSLSEFALSCETPMTISIQGDWGSGKTSAMYMMKESIENSVIPVWFNTWQFSQFEMQKELPLSLLSYFVEELDDQNFTFKKKISGLLKGLGKMTATIIAEQTVGETIAGKIADSEGSAIDSSKALKNLKDELQKIVEAKIKASGKNRIVVFIDDLDRLQPERAVEILEVLKLFLDIPSCVFILAVDYNVVAQGVKKKYGDYIDEAKGRSFFDKIIQLPFNLPVSQYDINSYFRQLLEKAGIDFTNSDIRIYRDLAAYSIGINPRSLKRLFNLMLLLNITAKNNNLLELTGNIKKLERQRVMFAILCMQTSFEEIYQYLLKANVTEQLLRLMSNPIELRTNMMFDSLRKKTKDDHEIDRIAEFIEIFIDSLQTDFDGKDELSKEEITNFIEVMRFSSITSIDDNQQKTILSYDDRKENRDAMKEMAATLNKKYKSQLESNAEFFTEPHFLFYQPKNNNYAMVYLEFNHNGTFQINFVFEKDKITVNKWDNGSKINSTNSMAFFNNIGFNEVTLKNSIIYTQELDPSLTKQNKIEIFTKNINTICDQIFDHISK